MVEWRLLYKDSFELSRRDSLQPTSKGSPSYKAGTRKYWQAGLTVFNSLLQEPYLSTDANHQGLLLHTIYHQPNGWDHIPEGSKIANGESVAQIARSLGYSNPSAFSTMFKRHLGQTPQQFKYKDE